MYDKNNLDRNSQMPPELNGNTNTSHYRPFGKYLNRLDPKIIVTCDTEKVSLIQ